MVYNPRSLNIIGKSALAHWHWLCKHIHQCSTTHVHMIGHPYTYAVALFTFQCSVLSQHTCCCARNS